jgi:hypothetical protein
MIEPIIISVGVDYLIATICTIVALRSEKADTTTGITL